MTLEQQKVARIAIMASGGGSNAKAILQYSQKYSRLLEVALIVSDNPQAKVSEVAEQFQCPYYCIPFQKNSQETLMQAKIRHEKEILSVLQQYSIDWIVLAGYMRLLSPYFIKKFQCQRYPSRILNIHPSLLPVYPGKDAYQQAFEDCVPYSGVTIHFVDEGMDSGPIIIQQRFPRNQDDCFMDFKNRGLAVEHSLYPRLIKEIMQDFQDYKRGPHELTAN